MTGADHGNADVANTPCDLPRYVQILRDHRERAGLSQRKLGAALGLGRGSYNALESSRSTVNDRTADIFRAAAAFLNMPAAALEEALAEIELRLTQRVAHRHRAKQPQALDHRPEWSRYLIDLRISRGLTSSAAARRLGVSQPTWTGMETGYRMRGDRAVYTIPKEDTLLRIAEALHLTDAELHRLTALADQLKPETASGLQPWQTQLRAARLNSRMTMHACARLAKVSLATYRGWETHPDRNCPHATLRALLAELGMSAQQVEEFMAQVPASTQPVRAPKQPTKPVNAIPAWSRFITDKRVQLGLYMTDVDERVGTPGVVRRYELGGWQRADGRLSVATETWLHRVADALEMTDAERRTLLDLADRERLAVAARGASPLVAEILAEARRATGLTQREAQAKVGDLPFAWSAYEAAKPAALDSLTPAVLDLIAERLPVRPLLAQTLRAVVLVPNRTITLPDVAADDSEAATSVRA